MKKFLKWWCSTKGHKYLNGGRGVISILLVMVMLPFVSLADMLVESARYHSAITILDEAMDSSSLSVLADYDQYLYKRFGLLAVNNSADISGTYSDYLKKNTESLKAWRLNNVEAEGKYTLRDEDILIKQIADFSQYSAPAALAGDLGLSDLISALEKMTKLTAIFDIVTGVGKTTNAALKMSEGLAKLKGKAESVEMAKADYDSKYAVFEAANRDLVSASAAYEQKNENVKAVERKLNEFDKASQINQKMKEIDEELNELEKEKENGNISEQEYEDAKKNKEEEKKELEKELEAALNEQTELKKELQTANEELITAKNELETERIYFSNTKEVYSHSITTLVNCWGEYQTEADAVLESADSLTTSVIDLGTKIVESEVKQEQLQEELKEEKQKKKEDKEKEKNEVTREEYDKSIAEIDKQINDLQASGNTSKAVGNTIKNEAAGYADMVQENMKEYDKEKIQEYVEELNKVQTRLNELSENSISSKSVYDKNLYYVVIEDGFLSSTGIQFLMDSIENKVSNGSIWELIDGFGTAMRSLFTTEAYFDTRLTSYIAEDSGYSRSSMDLVLEDFSRLINLLGDNVITGLVNIFTRFNEIMDSMERLVQHILDYLQGMMVRAVAALAEIGSNQCGEKILLDEYLLKTLSNRTDMTPHGKMGGTNPFTGYSFEKVKFSEHRNQVPQTAGIVALLELLRNVKNGGNDYMFSGAELEYILVGSRSEVVNQMTVFFEIYFVRFLIDAPQILFDPEVGEIAATAGPFGAFIVYLLYLFAEPFIDTLFIVNKIPISLLYKVVYLAPTGIGDLIGNLTKLGLKNEYKEALSTSANKISEKGTAKVGGGGIFKKYTWDYENYMFLLLMISIDNQTAAKRFANIVTLESKACYGQENFSIDKTYTYINGTVGGTFDPILPLGGIAVNGMFEQKRSRMRGY